MLTSSIRRVGKPYCCRGPRQHLRRCERIVQPSAPNRPIERGLAGQGLLAHVLVAKYCDHQPLYRQTEMYAREGVELERSTFADWVCGSSLVAIGGRSGRSLAWVAPAG